MFKVHYIRFSLIIFVLIFTAVVSFQLTAANRNHERFFYQEKNQNNTDSTDTPVLRQWLEMRKYDDIFNALKIKYKKARCSPQEYKIYAAARIQAYQDLFITRQLIDRIFGDHYYHAKQSIERALKKNRNDIEAKYLRGYLHKIRRQYKEAEPLFREAVSRDSCFDTFTLSDPYRELADIYRQQERWSDLDDLYTRQLTADSSNGWLRIEKAIAAAESETGNDYYQLYLRGLSNLEDSNKLYTLFNDYRVIATDIESFIWDRLENNQQKKDFLETFWKKRDENPLDTVNLFFREFYRRLGYARSWYPKREYPYYDDRGKIYIRLGKPDYIFVYPADTDMKENHSWIYYNLEGGMHFDFVSNWQYLELRPLTHAIMRTDPHSPPPSALYHVRRHIDPFYQKISDRLTVQKEILKNHQAQIELIEAVEILDQRKIESDSRKMFMERLSRIPVLNLHKQTAYFRETEDSIRQDFYFVIPFQNLIFNSSGSDSSYLESTVNCKSALMDIYSQKIIKTYEEKFSLSVPSNQINKRFLFNEIRFTALPGRYRFVTQITNNNDSKMNLIDRSVEFFPYSRDSLEISDIQFGISGTEQMSDDRFIKPHSNISFIPYPLSVWDKQQPLMIYYEMYNLFLDNFNRTDYEITYELKSSEQKTSLFSKFKSWFSRSTEKPFIRMSTGNKTGSRSVRETMTFDVHELPKGIYRLAISVTDKLSGQSNMKSVELELK